MASIESRIFSARSKVASSFALPESKICFLK
jgi:hypothetical protein